MMRVYIEKQYTDTSDNLQHNNRAGKKLIKQANTANQSQITDAKSKRTRTKKLLNVKNVATVDWVSHIRIAVC